MQRFYEPTNPFFLPPQSVLSFSGGRTSGFMLKQRVSGAIASGEAIRGGAVGAAQEVVEAKVWRHFLKEQ